MRFEKAIPLDYEIIPLTGYRRVVAVDPKTNTVYISNGSTLEKTVDWGTTFETVHNFGSRVDYVEPLADGALLVITLNKKVWRYIGGAATEVLQATGTPLNGVCAYGNFVMFGEYAVGYKGRIQFSSDYGVTWRTILTMDPSDPTVDHVHDVRFDPYENLIWSVWGDGRPADTVFFTDDFGATWQTLADKHYIRATSIIPLPDCVLFGTDQYYTVGTYRHDRPHSGTSQSDVRPYLDWRARKDTFEANAVTWATRAAITYGGPDDAIAFWGYHQASSGAGILPAAIYASDGGRPYPVWCQDKLADGTDGNGIEGVWGPTASGHLIADLRSIYPDSEGINRVCHILKIDWSSPE